MSKYEDSNKKNITTILHSLKEDYCKKFKKKIDLNQEPALIEIAKKIKKVRGEFEWGLDENNMPFLKVIKNGRVVKFQN
jgi:hypothetical protein